MQMVVEDRLRYVRGPRGRLRKRDCYKRWLVHQSFFLLKTFTVLFFFYDEAVQERRKEKMVGVADKDYWHHA